MQWLWLLTFILIVLWLLSTTKLSRQHWAAGMLATFTILAYFQLFSVWLWLTAALLASLCIAPLFASAWRKKHITSPIFSYMKQALPQMSVTEKEALAAGNTWWDAELFSGKPDWSILNNTLYPKLTAEEQVYLDHEVQILCDMLDDWDITHKRNDLPPEVWQFIRDKRFFALIIPKKYGGLAFSAFAHSEIIQKISSRSLSAAVTIMVPNSLGPAELLLSYGTPTQKDYYLPRLASAEDIPCFALTAPSAGSDAGAIPDAGIVCKEDFEGKQTLGFRINWQKRYITLGPVATLLGLAFHAYDPDHLLGEQEDLGITCALIPTNSQGITIGNRHLPLNAAFMNGPNSGKDVFVPMDWLIGGQKNIGKGWLMLVERLAVGRGISLPSLSTGAAKHAVYTTYTYANIRQQFHLPIAKFEGVEEVLARMVGKTYMMDAGRSLTLASLDNGERPAVITAIMKYYLTEGMRDIINDAMDIHGGRGICMGPSNYLARMYQTIPVGITVEGANILTRTLIIFGQGSMRCHPFVHQELNLLSQEKNDTNISAFDDILLQHVSHVSSNMATSLLSALTGSLLLPSPQAGETATYYRHLQRFSAAFASLSDLALLLLGGSLKRKEKLSGRFADALGYMYLCSATLWRFQQQGKQSNHAPMMHWACQHALFQVQEALSAIIREFPATRTSLKIAKFKIKCIIFPFGKHLQPPSDQLGHVLTQSLADAATLQHLTHGIYQSHEKNDSIGRLQYAYDCLQQSQAIEQRLKTSGLTWRVGLQDYPQWIERIFSQQHITEDEKTKLLATYHAMQKAIAVDDFATI